MRYARPYVARAPNKKLGNSATYPLNLADGRKSCNIRCRSETRLGVHRRSYIDGAFRIFQPYSLEIDLSAQRRNKTYLLPYHAIAA